MPSFAQTFFVFRGVFQLQFFLPGELNCLPDLLLLFFGASRFLRAILARACPLHLKTSLLCYHVLALPKIYSGLLPPPTFSFCACFSEHTPDSPQCVPTFPELLFASPLTAASARQALLTSLPLLSGSHSTPRQLGLVGVRGCPNLKHFPLTHPSRIFGFGFPPPRCCFIGPDSGPLPIRFSETSPFHYFRPLPPCRSK